MSLVQTASAAYGSLRWRAPELLQPASNPAEVSQLCAESDVYALAMVMLEVGFVREIETHLVETL